ncbi:DUF2807 domain-containing protein [Microbacterium sp. SY138]|uniref:GIN domain-containing protein n=1 Tax=Microbacterium sp. SY138 TaxID=3149040 RepID=UPI00321A553A
MTDKTLYNERINGKLIMLPDPVAQPDIAAALDKLKAISAARREAIVVRDTASATLAQAMTSERDDIAKAMLDDLSFVPEGVAETTLEAQTVARTAQTRLSGLVEARRLAVDELEAAVAGNGKAWGKTMRERAASAVLTLTTALDMAVKARLELDEAVGVLKMLEARKAGDDPALNLAMRGGNHAIAIGTAIDNLREALVAAQREVEGL